MWWKKTSSEPCQPPFAAAWRSHYEVIVTRHQVEYLVARVPSPSAAERFIRRTCREVELSPRAFRWQRASGVHPVTVTRLCVAGLLLAPLMPWGWMAGGLSVICLALLGGLWTSGREWRRGGVDDR